MILVGAKEILNESPWVKAEIQCDVLFSCEQTILSSKCWDQNFSDFGNQMILFSAPSLIEMSPLDLKELTLCVA